MTEYKTCRKKGCICIASFCKGEELCLCPYLVGVEVKVFKALWLMNDSCLVIDVIILL